MGTEVTLALLAIVGTLVAYVVWRGKADHKLHTNHWAHVERAMDRMVQAIEDLPDRIADRLRK